MEICSLKIQNFMSIGTANLVLNDRGLVLIQGENKDDSSASSNGAGKSSIPDAINWCLFGETARGESGDSIVNRVAKKNTVVSIELKDGDKHILIERHRKHATEKNRLKLSVGDKDRTYVDMTGGTDKLTQQTIISLLGCSSSVFSSAIYAAQEKMPNLPAMTDRQLKELIEEAAGINELQTMHERAKMLARQKTEAVDEARIQIDRAEQKKDWLEKQLASAELDSKRWEAETRTQIAELLEQIRAYVAGKFAGKSPSDYIGGLKEEIAAVQDRLDGLYQKIKAPDEAGEALDKSLKLAERRVTDLSTKVKLGKNEILSLRESLAKIESQIGTPCRECGKTYHEEDLETAREARRASLREKQSLFKTLAEAYEKARTERDNALEAVRAHAESRVAIDGLRREASELEDHIHRKKELVHAAIMAVDSIKEREKRIESLKAWTNPSVAIIDDLLKQIEKIGAKLDELVEGMGALKEEQELYEAAVQTFSPSGVRAHILDHVTPYLNARTAHYLSSLSDGNLSASWSTLSTTAKGELRERFVIEVSNSTGGDSFGLLSGGEKRKVRLSCALALQDLVATRATKPFRLFIADEIDDALDAAGLERLMSILDEKARERGTVLVISHNSLSDWIREVVVVKKSGGKSIVEGALCVK